MPKDELLYVYENTPFAHWHERAIKVEGQVAVLTAENKRLREVLGNIKLWCEGATCEICGIKEMKDTDCYDYVTEALRGGEKGKNGD